MISPSHTLPLVLFEDDDLLAIHKPAGINTHKPDSYAQDGIHEWLTKQRPEWRSLSILHRLDKETSGVMVFGKTAAANQSLTKQFERGKIKKTYLLLTAAKVDRQDACPTVATPIEGKPARTAFRVIERSGDATLVEARPETGRTHQVRIHAAQAGFPILGDSQYGWPHPAAPRMMLHASKLELKHPQTGADLRLEAPWTDWDRLCNDRSKDVPVSFTVAECLRELLFETTRTNSYRLLSGAADGCPGLIADRFGEVVLVQQSDPHPMQPLALNSLRKRFRVFVQQVQPGTRSQPRPLDAEGGPVTGLENGLRFLIRMDQGFSPGLFLDQRENRRHLRESAAGREVLNCFAYTCSFSVAAAAGGGKTTSLDLSRSYLDWGRENFRANKLNPDEHDFIYGDVFDWLKRFAKRGRQWDVVLLDPPTFGTTKKGRIFRAARDYFDLVALASSLVHPNGTLFCSTNQRSVEAGEFSATIQRALRAAGREVRAMRFETQPLDFRVAEGEQPYLKTFWIALD